MAYPYDVLLKIYHDFKLNTIFSAAVSFSLGLLVGKLICVVEVHAART